MSNTIFDPEYQELDLPKKITVGLDRISAAFKVLLWEKAKKLELSPIQIQILIFATYHAKEYCTVSYIATEFNITKATVSDTIRVLHEKKLLVKDYNIITDKRSYYIKLTTKGKQLVKETELYSLPIEEQLTGINAGDLEFLYKHISHLVYQLNQNGILSVQRICFSCQYYSKMKGKSYCNMLKKPLKDTDIRLDCPEYSKSTT